MSEDQASREKTLLEGEDYYIDAETGFVVLTAKYLKDRGYCCENNCRHCPYIDKPDDN